MKEPGMKDPEGMEKRDLERREQEEQAKISETWAQETIEDLDDFIESQGIYIRQ